jgi:hypothetical protein
VGVEHCRWNEHGAARDVSGSEDVRDGGPEEIVGRDEPPIIELDARGAEVETSGVGHPTDRDDHQGCFGDRC